MSLISYDQFIADKQRLRMPHGFDPLPITAPLFDWQKYVVGLAIKAGRYALFEDCGLGKTLQQLEWARQVTEHTGRPVIILTPLAVASQTATEAKRFGYKAKVCKAQKDVPAAGIAITNYEKLEHFDPGAFAGVVLDESSILKNFTGKTRKALTDAFARTQYRLCCTATPSPNDYTEFGQHADFLGLCTPAQMLCTYFINDTFNTGDWRLKRHAEEAFWRWVASWAACVSKPSDIGFPDDGYILPPLRMRTETVDVDILEERPEDELFRVATLSATTMHKEMRLTVQARAAKVAELVHDSPDEHWLIWCNTNDEASILADLLPEAVELRGSDSADKKEAAADWFKGLDCTEKQLALIGKQAKLSACGNQNMPSEEGSDTQQIQQSASGEGNTEGRQRKTDYTCALTTSQTKQSLSSRLSNESSETQTADLNTHLTQRIVKKSTKRLSNSTSGILSLEKRVGSKNTESPSGNSTPCSPRSTASVQSADTPTFQIETSSRLLTTITELELREDYCACRATKDSESSATIRTGCAPQQNISSARVLISKPSIFGSGLNFQHCRNVAFVGLSYSFEDFYQALRRSYRFGQTKPVNAYIIQAATEGAILQAVQAKIEQHQKMQEQMKLAANYLRKST